MTPHFPFYIKSDLFRLLLFTSTLWRLLRARSWPFFSFPFLIFSKVPLTITVFIPASPLRYVMFGPPNQQSLTRQLPGFENKLSTVEILLPVASQLFFISLLCTLLFKLEHWDKHCSFVPFLYTAMAFFLFFPSSKFLSLYQRLNEDQLQRTQWFFPAIWWPELWELQTRPQWQTQHSSL